MGTYSLIQQMLTEHLRCVRHCSGCQGRSRGESKVPGFMGLTFWRERQDVRSASRPTVWAGDHNCRGEEAGECWVGVQWFV